MEVQTNKALSPMNASKVVYVVLMTDCAVLVTAIRCLLISMSP